MKKQNLLILALILCFTGGKSLNGDPALNSCQVKCAYRTYTSIQHPCGSAVLLICALRTKDLQECKQVAGTFPYTEEAGPAAQGLAPHPKKDTFQYFTVTDTLLSKYRLPAVFKKPQNWTKAETARSEREFYGNSYPVDYRLEDALAAIDTAKDFSQVCAAKSWCLKNEQLVFPHLVARLSHKQKVGLTNTADLIIWDRIGTGDLQFYGHGGVITEDLFTVAGRASWILNELTGEKFSVVRATLTPTEAENLKKRWISYIRQLK